MRQFPLNAIAPCSWAPEESEVESSEHQDNANIHGEPFPESVSEEHEIHTDDDGCHRQHIKHDSSLSAHFSSVRLIDFRMAGEDCVQKGPGISRADLEPATQLASGSFRAFQRPLVSQIPQVQTRS
jgi:hypothetical protein